MTTTTVRSITRRGLLRLIAVTTAAAAMTAATGGCAKEPGYGTERQLTLPGRRQVWAVAPAINLSGQSPVDPLLQADLLYQQLQQVDGITAVPVNRVAAVYASLGIEQVQSPEQAGLVCDLLGCDGLLVPTVTAYDPYDPPKVGASLQLFRPPRRTTDTAGVSPRELARRAAPGTDESLPARPRFAQVVGMFDAANGSVRDALWRYAQGRSDPIGPLGAKEYLVSMDRFGGFVYHMLLEELMDHPRVVERF